MNCGIYQIENTANGKRYIGSSNQIRRRFYLHKWSLRRGDHHSITLQRSWNKYGESMFVFKVLIFCSIAMLHFYEQKCLDKMETIDPAKGFNICCDAAAAGTGRIWTDAQKKAKSIERKGKKVSLETLETLKNCHQCGEDHHMFGKHHTPEALKKMSDKLQGRAAWNKGKHTNNNQAKITTEQVLEIRRLTFEAGHPRYSRQLSNFQRELGIKLGLKLDTIHSICSGHSRPNVGGLPCLQT